MITALMGLVFEFFQRICSKDIHRLSLPGVLYCTLKSKAAEQKKNINLTSVFKLYIDL